MIEKYLYIYEGIKMEISIEQGHDGMFYAWDQSGWQHANEESHQLLLKRLEEEGFEFICKINSRMKGGS